MVTWTRLGMNSNRRAAALLLTLATTCGLANAGAPAEALEPSDAPGVYVTEGGWGRLTLGPATAQGQAIAIHSAGANGHSCTLEGGLLTGRQARWPTDAQVCQVELTPIVGGGWALASSTPEACRYFCGARAGFEGDYWPLPPACEAAAWRRSGEAFLAAYRGRDYARALDIQHQRLQACETRLFWLQAFQVRNDLAIAQFHAGQKAACLATLKPILAQSLSDLAPADAEGFAPILKAARFNQRQCQRR